MSRPAKPGVYLTEINFVSWCLRGEIVDGRSFPARLQYDGRKGLNTLNRP